MTYRDVTRALKAAGISPQEALERLGVPYVAPPPKRTPRQLTDQERREEVDKFMRMAKRIENR